MTNEEFQNFCRLIQVLAPIVVPTAPAGKPLTSEEMERIIAAAVAQRPDLAQEDVAKLRAWTYRTFTMTIEEGDLLAEEHCPWVSARWRELDGRLRFWEHYHDVLVNLGRAPVVITDIDRSTDEILDLCGNPTNLSSAWQRRGLVIGDVQSGKTGVFAGLLCKAADAGYKVVIVLAGLTNSLRSQTQLRLDRDFCNTAPSTARTRATGGLPVYCFTSVDHDFGSALKQPNASLNTDVDVTNLFVVKKNSNILNNLATWLEKDLHCKPGDKLIDVPLLIVDDEADSASVNTNDEDKEASAINAAIRRILRRFRHASYVGFTATPYANVFINPTGPDGEDDLFPRDFIAYTSVPRNYFGVHRMIDARLAFEKDPAYAGTHVHFIEDAKKIFPGGHKRTLADELASGALELPPSLLTAVRQFLIANAIRDLRGQKNTHRSMLVNVSRFTCVQQQLARRLHDELSRIVTKISNFARALNGRHDPEIKTLKALFESDFAGCGFDWDTVCRALPSAVAGISCVAFNQEDNDTLDYRRNDKNGLRVIVVGGLALSRGLTLDGLCCSYLYRNTAAYDTLLQMGRWFGYRDGYEDVCRIWMGETTFGYYRNIAEASDLLKADIARMRREHATPREFGLKVLNSPGALTITSRNKMRHSVNATVQGSLSASFTETTCLKREDTFGNVEAVRKLFDAARALPETTFELDRGRTPLLRNVPKSLVARFLRDFKTPAEQIVQITDDGERGGGTAGFVEETDVAQLQTWDVAIFSTQSGAPVPAEWGWPEGVRAISRPVKQGPWREDVIRFARAHVSGPDVESVGIEPERAREIERAAKSASETRFDNGCRIAFRYARNRPMLVVMPVRLNNVGEDEGVPEDVLMVPTYGLIFCNFEDRNARKTLASYKVNRVWLEQHGEGADEGDEDE